MGHNVSNAERRRNLLKTTTRVLAPSDWTLTVQCATCRRHRSITLSDLAMRHGEVELGRVLDRLRCSGARAHVNGVPLPCRDKPATAVVTNRLHTVILIGPGALA